jgi:hypothetical protein
MDKRSFAGNEQVFLVQIVEFFRHIQIAHPFGSDLERKRCTLNGSSSVGLAILTLPSGLAMAGTDGSIVNVDTLRHWAFST